MSKKKILILLDGDYSQDIRVRKQTRIISSLDVEITVLCARLTNDLYGSRFGEEKILLASLPKPLERLNRLIERLFFFNSIFYWKLRKLLSSNVFDIIHVHDLPLASTVLRATRPLTKQASPPKMILDLHEVWPHALRDWHGSKSGFPGQLILLIHSFKRWLEYERDSIHKFDHTIVVVDEMFRRIMRIHGIDSAKLSVIENCEFSRTKYVRIWKNAEKNTNPSPPKTTVSFGYIGGLDFHRGLDQLILAFSRSLFLRENAQLKIFGDGDKPFIHYLSKLINTNCLQKNFQIFGHVPLATIASNSSYHFDIGCIPHKKTGHTDNTIPHKLFQYIELNIPILASDCKPLKRIVKKNELGEVFRSGEITDLIEKMELLVEQALVFKKNSQNLKKREKSRPDIKHFEVYKAEFVKIYEL